MCLVAKKTKMLKQKEYCNKFNKDFKNGPYPKKNKKQKTKNLSPIEPRTICILLCILTSVLLTKENKHFKMWNKLYRIRAYFSTLGHLASCKAQA